MFHKRLATLSCADVFITKIITVTVQWTWTMYEQSTVNTVNTASRLVQLLVFLARNYQKCVKTLYMNAKIMSL